jgi:orotate phosphoribosyltransferase
MDLAEYVRAVAVTRRGEPFRLASGAESSYYVDDVVSTGGSTLKALDAVLEAGAVVVAAIPVVDRGGGAARLFTERGVLYIPLISHDDLGIPALGTE